MELPRHLQGSSSSASSHASSSPPGSLPRSPALATSYLPSPPLHPVPLPSSPSAPAQNRFGLALNFIHRRPRGQSLSANAPSTSPGSTQLSPAVSPAGENPPSPGGERERGGYGFPALRRQLSKRPSSSGSGSPAPDAARARTQRSASQPPAPSPNLATNASGSTPLLDAVPPSFSTPTPTTSSIPLATPPSTAPSSLATTPRLRLAPPLDCYLGSPWYRPRQHSLQVGAWHLAWQHELRHDEQDASELVRGARTQGRDSYQHAQRQATWREQPRVRFLPVYRGERSELTNDPTTDSPTSTSPPLPTSKSPSASQSSTSTAVSSSSSLPPTSPAAPPLPRSSFPLSTRPLSPLRPSQAGRTRRSTRLLARSLIDRGTQRGRRCLLETWAL